ncbi:hypothetical protein O6H91_15G060900 [Diphasiastrum complanatum]|uniref:Uncharacterized protein n=1 Tax=Diphasiastrum complanatum TaxID=34168 RepID=A0ACC2BIQ4_DIPCM|nr:hypothetical protein O6H91_15G060900 [Diphasiastrum complanatum]
MEFRLNLSSRVAKEWIYGHTTNPYKRLHKQHCSSQSLKIRRMKDMQLTKKSQPLKANQNPGCKFMSPVALLARLNTAYRNILMKAKSLGDVRQFFQSMGIPRSRRSTSKLTKFEKHYIQHLRRILEDGQSVVI